MGLAGRLKKYVVRRYSPLENGPPGRKPAALRRANGDQECQKTEFVILSSTQNLLENGCAVLNEVLDPVRDDRLFGLC
jgi:hypothetical protein